MNDTEKKNQIYSAKYKNTGYWIHKSEEKIPYTEHCNKQEIQIKDTKYKKKYTENVNYRKYKRLPIVTNKN